jgi:uncharacterized protein YprB with RNaseH-like and TPR domain
VKKVVHRAWGLPEKRVSVRKQPRSQFWKSYPFGILSNSGWEMNPTEDKLSRVAALRPVRLPDPARAYTSNSDQLTRMLDGETVCNRLGSHIRVQNRFPQPSVTELCSRALCLLEPGNVDTVCDAAKWVFLDTETTGLAGGTGTYAFLVGLAWWHEDGFVIEQHFMRDHSEEPSVLLAIAERFAGERVLVTFNGKSFDWPLLKTRFQMSRAAAIPAPWPI